MPPYMHLIWHYMFTERHRLNTTEKLGEGSSLPH